MKLKKGTVVLSLAGRDKGKLLAVVGEEEGRILLSDGRERPLNRPKRKNPLHLRPMEFSLPEEAFRGNRALKKALKECLPRSEVEKDV